jgi:hypothetical protein
LPVLGRNAIIALLFYGKFKPGKASGVPGCIYMLYYILSRDGEQEANDVG